MISEKYFCIGAAKTGTTILARLLDQQVGVSCMSEAYFLRPRHRSSVLNPEGSAWVKHGLPEDLVRQWHRRATTSVWDGRKVDAIRHPDHLRAIVTEVLSVFSEVTGSSIVGDKWPYYHSDIDLLLEAFPDARYVYNVRDPRAVWNSGDTFLAREMGNETVADMLGADQAIEPYLDDERFLLFRYEDLVVDPHTTMKRLADFLGFDYRQPRGHGARLWSRWRRSVFDYDPATDPLPGRWEWVPAVKGGLDPGLTEKWRHEMDDRERSRVTEWCADFIDRYGYA